jgi:hypothetical protein
MPWRYNRKKDIEAGLLIADLTDEDEDEPISPILYAMTITCWTCAIASFGCLFVYLWIMPANGSGIGCAPESGIPPFRHRRVLPYLGEN